MTSDYSASYTAFIAASAASALAAHCHAQCQKPTQVIDLAGVEAIVMDNGLLVARAQAGVEHTLISFRLEGPQWVERDRTAMQNGGTLALSGDLLVVGRERLDPRTVDIFRRDSRERWQLEAVLSTAAPGERYGYAVAVSGNTVIVGEPEPDRNQVHFYALGAGGWDKVATFAAPTAEHDDFGYRVAIDGDLAAAHAQVTAHEAAVLIYRRSGALWSFDTELRIPSRAGAIDLHGERLLVSSYNPGGPGRIYRFDGAQWVREARLEGTRGSSYASRPAQIDGNAILIPQGHDAEIDVENVSYLFLQLPGGEWRRSRRLLADSIRSTDGIAVDGAWAAVRGVDTIQLFDLSQLTDPCPPAPPIDSENGLLVSAAGVLSPQTPQTSVLVRAFFESDLHAMAGVIFDVRASEPGWAEPRLIPPGATGPGTWAGFVDGRLVTDAIAGQLSFHSIYPDPSNPLDVWEADFSVTDFTPRVIDVQVPTYIYAVYPERGGATSVLRTLGIIDPETAIRVWGSSCLADCDGSGALDFFDFLCFQELFDAGNLACDFDEDGALTLFDFLAFQNFFSSGCP